jgi:hypothetical protein
MTFEYGGWIVWCDGVIYGTGLTADGALADAREWAPDWDGAHAFPTGNRETSNIMYIARATNRLIDAVRRGHTDVAHFSANGVRDLL